MNLRQVAGRVKRNASRRKYVVGVDSVEKIQSRQPSFSQVRNDIRRAGTDNLAHFQNEYSHEGGLSLQQNPDEFAALICFLKEYSEKNGSYTTYMEIGSASGGTCLFLYKEFKFVNVLSLDDGTHPRAAEQKDNFRDIPGLRQFIGDSHSKAAQEFLVENMNEKLDVAFIDGDHSYSGVRADLELTLPFCRPGTLIIFHDTVACDGVEKLWIEAISSKKIYPLAEYVGVSQGFGIGVGRVL